MTYIYKKKIKDKYYFYLRSSSRKKGKISVKDISYLGTSLDKIISKAKADKEISSVLLFGSSLKRQGRDIDICLILNQKKSNYEMTNKRLEYLKKFSNYDIQIFQQLPLYIRIRIIKEHLILLCKNKEELFNLAFQTIKEFNMFEKALKLCLDKTKNG